MKDERNRGVNAVGMMMTMVLVAAVTAGMVLVPTSSGAGMTGDERFEASLRQLVEEANTQVVSQLENDPTTANVFAGTNSGSEEAAPREAISVGTISGVPGDPKFEAEFATWLRQADEQLKNELSNDPTGVGRVR
jgi:hypothetical protein